MVNGQTCQSLETFTAGDTIGFGVNFDQFTAFFTKNGRFLGKSIGVFIVLIPDAMLIQSYSINRARGYLRPTVSNDNLREPKCGGQHELWTKAISFSGLWEGRGPKRR